MTTHNATSLTHLRSTALLSHLTHLPQNALLDTIPLLQTLGGGGGDGGAGYDVVGGTSASSSASARVAHCKRITDALELSGSGEQTWIALQNLRELMIGQSVGGGGGGEGDNNAPSSAAYRTQLDTWCKSLLRLLRSLLEPRLTSSLPPLTPILTLATAETLLAVMDRIYTLFPDMRREVTGTMMNTVVPLVCKLVKMSQTEEWGRATTGKTKNTTSSSTTVSTPSFQWTFPPSNCLLRSLRLLLILLTSYRHSLRAFTDRILSISYPLLGYLDSEEVREVVAKIIAAVAMIQPSVPVKRKQGDGGANDGEGDEAMTAAEDGSEENKSNSKASTQQHHSTNASANPWLLCFHRTLNTIHTMLDELDEAGDGHGNNEQGQQQQYQAWKNIALTTDEVLPLPPLTASSSSSSTSSLSRTRHFSSRLRALFQLLEVLHSRELFQDMFVSNNNNTSVNSNFLTLSFDTTSLHSVFHRLLSYDLNPYTLQQITGQNVLNRVQILLVLPELIETALDFISSLIDTIGLHFQPVLPQYVRLLTNLYVRYAWSTQDGKYVYPRLVTKVYGVLIEILHSQVGVTSCNSSQMMREFILPMIDNALEDAQRVVKVKNQVEGYARGLVMKAAFSGAGGGGSTSTEGSGNKKRNSIGGNNSTSSSTSDSLTSYTTSLNLPSLSLISVSALEFLDTILLTCGRILPLQKRIGVDRTLCMLAMAIQNTSGSWNVIESYRYGVYQCLTSSVLTPVAASSGSGAKSSYNNNNDSSSSTSSTHLHSSFPLLPYALSLFTNARRLDSSSSIRTLVTSSMRICETILHPRSQSLGEKGRVWVQGGRGGGHQNESSGSGIMNGMMMMMNDSEENQMMMGGGLIQGRDGSLYMQQPQQQQQQQHQSEDHAASTTAVAATSSQSQQQLDTQPKVGSKRPRDEEATDATETKRAHLEAESSNSAAVNNATQATAASSAPVAASNSAAASTSSDQMIVDDDDAPLLADDGPDADEGEQSVWNIM